MPRKCSYSNLHADDIAIVSVRLSRDDLKWLTRRGRRVSDALRQLVVEARGGDINKVLS